MTRYLSFIVFLYLLYLSFNSLKPENGNVDTLIQYDFQIKNAQQHVSKMAEKPHALGFPAHSEVRNYIVAELNRMGLSPELQQGYTIGNFGNYSKATNILARIPGKKNSKALMLMSHYDSSPHSSYGASDAASGVATILEGVRALMGKTPSLQNDLIILITDAEELGLNGARLFANQHPWADDVGLILNFEARGSGGPSYMLIETNRGNERMIKEFAASKVPFPVANSLAYSIYKMLPNDTDLTVFREDRDIDGFNFAFIDDHFDYHTALDRADRLDESSLAHQATYLMPLLEHFSQTDLSNLKSPNDRVYFNLPFLKMVHYPFDWIFPMILLAWGVFLALLLYGFRKKKLKLSSVLKGFGVALLVLVITGFTGYFAWPFLKWWYPWYADILHGFPYSGYGYIATMTAFAAMVCFFFYDNQRKLEVSNLVLAPIVLWLSIATASALYLKGAAFLVIPVFGLLAGFLLTLTQQKHHPWIQLFLAMPSLFILAPFIKMFPVGLGLKMLLATTLMVVLLFFTLLPYFASFKSKIWLSIMSALIFVGMGIKTHVSGSFITEEQPKPNSLLYIKDDEQKRAFWASYDQQISTWSNNYFTNKDTVNRKEIGFLKTLSSKYKTQINRIAPAPMKEILSPEIVLVRDTVLENNRKAAWLVKPQRLVNRLDIHADGAVVSKASINGKEINEFYLKNRKSSRLVTHFITDSDSTFIEVTIPKDEKLKMTFYESSNNLLSHPQFSIAPRPKDNIPMPFVLNDAIVTVHEISLE